MGGVQTGVNPTFINWSLIEQAITCYDRPLLDPGFRRGDKAKSGVIPTKVGIQDLNDVQTNMA